MKESIYQLMYLVTSGRGVQERLCRRQVGKVDFIVIVDIDRSKTDSKQTRLCKWTSCRARRKQEIV